MNNSIPSVKNPPMRLSWVGWESDTYRLGRAGWEISVHQDPHRGIMTFAIRHKDMDVRGMSHRLSFEYQRYRYSGFDLPPVEVQLANRFNISHVHTGDMFDFEPVDTVPRYEIAEITSIDDFKIFKPLPEQIEKEVYLKPASMKEILDLALAHQEPEQEQIRQQLLNEQYRLASDPVAQLRLVT